VTASAGRGPAMALSPSVGRVGTTVMVTGSNLTPRAGGAVTFGGLPVASFTTDRKGAFAASFSVPSTTAAQATVVAATGSLSARSTFTVTPSGSPSTGTDPAVLFGVSTPSGPRNLAEVDAFERQAGKRVGIVMYFEGWAYHEFDASLAASVAARGAVPEITWEPWDYVAGIDQPEYSLLSIISGTHDAYLHRWAQGAKAYGGPVLVRLGHEMNDRYYPWSESANGNRPGQYVAAWRHVVDVFRAVGATNVKWVWSPSVSYAGTIPLADVYPGDAYVDWVALDGYNGGSALPWGGWQSFAQIFGASLAEIAAITTAKPVMIGETSSAEAGGSKAAWITELFAELAQRSQIKGFVWFNQDKETDWRIESSPSATQAFATGVADQRYG
jgi:beta-mannanase